MVNGAVIEFLAQVPVANPLIRADQADLVRHSFVDESLQGRLLHVLNHASDYVALASNSAHDNRLTGSGWSRLSVALIPMPVLGLAADECFINFDDAAELGFGFDQGGTDFVSHQPSRFDRTETHVAAKLACGTEGTTAAHPREFLIFRNSG